MRRPIIYFSLAISLGVLLWFIVAWKTFLTTPLIPPHQSVDYVLKPGATIKTLAFDLQQQHLTTHPDFLILLAYAKGITKNLKAGEYLFTPGATPSLVLQQIAAGKVILRRFTLIEGWTFKQLLNAINNNPYLTHTINTMATAQIIAALGLPPENPEGLFLPATYHFTKGLSDIALLHILNQSMSKQLALAWQQRATDLPYRTPYEALTAASLIEKETAQPAERPIIAGVLIRRMQKNMPLQIDSTLIYGLGANYDGKLNRNSLAEDTLYNTYLHRGLPPTPIAMPSLQAIQAVLHPDHSDALYFVAKGNGTHQFSATLPAQNSAVTAYQIDIHFPKIGKRLYNRDCTPLWYLSVTLQNFFPCKIIL